MTVGCAIQRIVLAAVAMLVMPAAASAVFDVTTSAQGEVTTLELVAPSSAAASTMDACSSVDVSWSAVTAADTYRIEMRVDGGAWAAATPSTSGSTSMTDTTGHTPGAVVEYRIFAGDASSGWESPSATMTPAVTC